MNELANLFTKTATILKAIFFIHYLCENAQYVLSPFVFSRPLLGCIDSC